MIPDKTSTLEAHLFTYVIGSADMYYNPVNERGIYIYDHPSLGFVVRGKMRGIDQADDVNLSQILLEYAMACEEPYSQERENNAPICMGERLGKLLAKRLYQDMPEFRQNERICCMFGLVLRSMGVQYQIETVGKEIHFYLDECPIAQSAQKTGLYRSIVPARRSFFALCNGILCTLAPHWRMLHPGPWQADRPLRAITLQSIA